MNTSNSSEHVAQRYKRKTKRLLMPFGEHARFAGKMYAFDSHKAISGHMLIAGPSGSGKSHQLNRMILNLAEQGAKQIFVIDVHGDLGDFSDIARYRDTPIPNTLVQTINFGEQTHYGLPPLDLLDDPEGGPRKRANAFISLLNRQGALGPKQRTALFRLLIELYKQHGFMPDDPKTWGLDNDPRSKRGSVVPRPDMHALPGLNWFELDESEKSRIKKEYGIVFNGTGSPKFWEIPQDHPKADDALQRWGGGTTKRFPTLSDVKRHLWDKLVMMKMGVSAPSVLATEKVMALARKRARIRSRKLSEYDAAELEKLEAQLASAQEEAIAAFTDGIEKVDSGQELEELILWDSADAIKGLFDRIESLERSGIFKGEPPPFDQSVPVWRYNIKSLAEEEQMLFVDVLLERIFVEAKSRGEADGPDTFIIMDESHKFVTDEGGHIINRLIKEVRKFGVGMIMGSQAFMHFSDDQLMSSSIKLILACPEMYREPMRRKLGLEMVTFKNGRKYNPFALIKPKETALISIANEGENQPMEDIKIMAT